MSESLRNDGRVWVPQERGRLRQAPGADPRGRARLLPRAAATRASATWRRATSPSRRAKEACATTAAGVGPRPAYDAASTSTSRDAIKRLGQRRWSRSSYGNLFEMYERITDENPYKGPMRIYPAVHYTMGGLWVDYHLR